MRLQILDNGHSLFQKLILGLIKRSSEDHKAPGPVLVMSYRRELFGKHIAPCFQEAMRDMKAWTIGEVELFAAFVSSLNQCMF